MYKDFLVFANKTAFLNNNIWKGCMKKLELKSRGLRVCNFMSCKPKKNLAFYSDNCTMHSSQQARLAYARLWGIHDRHLIPNGTHVQQPVDQHIGNHIGRFIADKYWQFGEKLLDEIDDGKSEEEVKVGAKKKRELICKWSAEAVKATKKEKDLLRHAWINFGLYLPVNGSLDGDVDAIARKFLCVMLFVYQLLMKYCVFVFNLFKVFFTSKNKIFTPKKAIFTSKTKNVSENFSNYNTVLL